MFRLPLFQYSKLISNSIDSFIPAVADVFNGVEIEPIKANIKSSSCLSFTEARSMSLSSIYYGQDMKASFEMPNDFFLIIVITSGNALYQWNQGRKSSHSDINFLPASAALNMDLSADCTQFLLGFQSPEGHSEMYRKMFEVLPQNLYTSNCLKSLASNLVSDLHFSPNFDLSERLVNDFSNVFFDTLMSQGQTLIEQAPQSHKLDPRSLSGIQDIIDYMHAHPSQEFDANKLASIGNFSVRSFYSHFKQATGITPYQYCLNLRLYLVRQCLITPRFHHQSIAETAMEHGFFHLSRFSHHYRNLFGELPSRTLNEAIQKKEAIKRKDQAPSSLEF